jgi:tetratricopeptide (TPR) repeat protein
VAFVLDARVRGGDAVPPSELAYHYHSALPDGDPRKAVEWCRAAAAAAGAVFSGPDVVRYARHALEALDLLDRPSLRLRMSLLYHLAMYARSHYPREAEQAIREVAHMAAEQCDAIMLLRAAMLFHVAPGLPPLPGQAALLERVLTLFKPSDMGFRSVALSALALAAPSCYSVERSRALLEEALPLCRKSKSPLAHYSVLVGKLYNIGGPGNDSEANDVAAELERLAVQYPAQTPVLPVTLAFHRAVYAFQRGDRQTMLAALDRASMRARVLHSQQKIWYCQRFALLARLELGETRGAVQDLDRTIQTEQGTIWGAEVFCAFDAAVTRALLAQPAPLSPELHDALRFEPADPPGIWATKLRTLAECGRLDEARGALRAVPPAELGQLPCDADYLGTLGNLARAALLLRMPDYAEAVYGLLAPYSAMFAVGYTLYCDGSVAQLQGMLAHYLGRYETAATHLELGLRHNERAGLHARALETRLQLARCLRALRGGAAQALELAREAHAGATRLGQQRWIAEALQLFPDAGE